MSETTPNGIGILVRDLSYRYKDSELIFNQFNLNINIGEFVSILGPSGCGKSTLLRLISQLSHPDQGTIQFNSNFSPTRGFVFQEPRLLPWCSVLENVLLPLNLRGVTRQESVKKAMEMLEKVGLKHAVHQFPSQLSGGMKMRVSVARALIVQPSFLFLDEPFSALDETTRQSLQDDLRTLWKNLKMTVLFVTHSIEEAVYLSSRVIVLSNRPSKIVYDDKVNLPADRNDEVRLSHPFTLEKQRFSLKNSRKSNDIE